ncbi:interferon-induced, double-stranded RNA-activated protein kinase [Symphorus nematophorus]
METANYIAKLNEYAQRARLVLSYEDVGSVGPDHIKTFTVRAFLNGKAYPDGVGKNKKEAKQNAAKNALTGLLAEPADPTENAPEASTATVHQTAITQTNYVCWLNEYGHKNRVTIRAVESTRVGPNNAPQCCSFMVGDKEYPAATGRTKKEAKEEAAKLVYHEICGSKTTEPGEQKHISSSPPEENQNQNVSDICDKTKSLSVRTIDEGFAETNFISLINNYCQKTRRARVFVLENRCGPDHVPQFFYKLVIDNKDYPVGEGRSVKEAKQSAAQLAWSALQEQSDWDSKVSFLSALSDDAASARPSTLESQDTKSKNVPTTSSDFIVFTNSSTPSKDQIVQIESPDVKPKIRIAANFPLAGGHSKEDMVNFSGRNKGNSPSKKTKSVTSRFTSEFDSIMCLGKGAFGCVFKANQKLLRKNFAIKIVRCKEKALREVGALSDLHHNNIVRYYTCWLEDTGYQWDSTADSCSSSQSTGDSSIKYLYIQMELCDTKTLRVWIDEKNTQNWKKSLRDSKRRDESLTIVTQIVNGVEYIHSKMFIHRDLKPANIMFGQDGEVKIGDFGLVTAEKDDDAENVLERTVYKGTPSYMAPEQRNRSSTYDRKVDIFALGLIYFELLWNLATGHERKVIWDDVRNQKPPPGFLQYFPLENQIITSMLSVKPEDRPEANKVKTNLEEYTAHKLALKNMQTVKPAVTALTTAISLRRIPTASSFAMENINYVTELHDYARAKRWKLVYEDLGFVGPDHEPTFSQRVVLNGKVYPDGVGKNKKEAKQNAAKNALKCLLKNKHQPSFDSSADKNYNDTSSQQKEELDRTVSDICKRIRFLGVNKLQEDKPRPKPTNYIGIVDHYCRRMNYCNTYIEERRYGPSHCPRFVIKLIINSKEYPEAEGSTIKEARQNAARLAWSALQEQSNFDSKVSVRSTVSQDGGSPTLSARSTTLMSQGSPSESTPMSTSASVFTSLSNPPEAELPQIPPAPENDAPTRLSTPTSLESLASSQSMSTGTSGSEIFTDSSNSSKDHQHAVIDSNVKKHRNEKSAQSRFTSDFDSMERLGIGAYGCVYKARHKLSDEYYAVKIVCRRRDEQRCLREVGTLSGLHHPNIVSYNTSWMEDSGYQWDITAGSSSSSQSTDNSSAKYLYIQMELCDTKTLKDWIEEKNSLQDIMRREESLNIVRQIVSAVEYVHSKKHIHRDLKPENILFGLDGRVKIGDFGLVTVDIDDDAENVMMRTGYRGTTTYMAPEQMKEKTYDRKVDIFPLGLIYFELLWKLSTGHERAKVWEDARKQTLPEDFSLTFPQENQIIKSMLCEKPEDRPDASALKAELDKMAQTFSAQNV